MKTLNTETISSGIELTCSNERGKVGLIKPVYGMHTGVLRWRFTPTPTVTKMESATFHDIEAAQYFALAQYCEACHLGETFEP